VDARYCDRDKSVADFGFPVADGFRRNGIATSRSYRNGCNLILKADVKTGEVSMVIRTKQIVIEGAALGLQFFSLHFYTISGEVLG
jgi:hypothetical protein